MVLRINKNGKLAKGGNKFGAARTDDPMSCTYNGTIYDSRLEARYAATLDLLKRAGQIREWTRQVTVPLEVNGRHVCNMRVDFRVVMPNGAVEFHEVKGFSTPEWLLKKKLFQAIYPERTYTVIRKA